MRTIENGSAAPLALTASELQVLAQLGSPASFAEIAPLVGMSPGDVRSHAISIYRKFGVVNRSEALEHARVHDLNRTNALV